MKYAIQCRDNPRWFLTVANRWGIVGFDTRQFATESDARDWAEVFGLLPDQCNIVKV